MLTSKEGIELIKSFEGLRLTAYKPVSTEKYWTIGYGHYGKDVAENMVINEQQAEDMLKKDLRKYERAVNAIPYVLTQNMFDALVSFTYNCGIGNLNKLTNNNKRPLTIIADKILLYNKAGGKVLKGLQRRREAERELFLKK